MRRDVYPEINADQTISLFKEVEAVDPETKAAVATQLEIALVQQAWTVDANGVEVPSYSKVTVGAAVFAAPE